MMDHDSKLTDLARRAYEAFRATVPGGESLPTWAGEDAPDRRPWLAAAEVFAADLDEVRRAAAAVAAEAAALQAENRRLRARLEAEEVLLLPIAEDADDEVVTPLGRFPVRRIDLGGVDAVFVRTMKGAEGLVDHVREAVLGAARAEGRPQPLVVLVDAQEPRGVSVSRMAVVVPGAA